MALNPRTFFWLLRRSVVATFDDGCLGIAKGAAYSALLSFFPVLASAAAILVEMRAEFVSRIIERALSEIVPPDSVDLVVEQFRVNRFAPSRAADRGGADFGVGGLRRHQEPDGRLSGGLSGSAQPRFCAAERRGHRPGAAVGGSAGLRYAADRVRQPGGAGGAQLAEGGSGSESACPNLAVAEPHGAVCRGLR